MTKVYFSLWIVAAAFAGLLFVSGMLSRYSLMALGVFTVALIFIGIMGVLPMTMTDQSGPRS